MADNKSTSHDLADNLIALAEWLKARPYLDPFTARNLNIFIDGSPEFQREKLAELARELAPVEKTYSTYHAGIITHFGEITVNIYANREAVCTKKTETKIVPAIVIPARPATPEVTIPERTETVETWECSPLLDSTIPAVLDSTPIEEDVHGS